MAPEESAFTGFESLCLASGREPIFVRRGGAGPAVLLLHGFPQTGLMWRDVAPLLATTFTVFVADLPGYGRSGCPDDGDDHAPMSKRAMAATLTRAMRIAGYERFAIVGHDRGGRVAFRAALDHADCVSRAAVLDVIPTYDVWDRADARLALAFWPFSLLAQPAPFPERLITAAPDAIVDNAIQHWGSSPDAFPAWVRDAYIDPLRDPAHVHAICEEYRAAAGVDRQDDAADLRAGHRIACPLLALWSEHGPLATWYEDAGGPLGLWRRWANDVRGHPVSGGHFFAEEDPAGTARRLHSFLTDRD
ncbi:alpha/beta hydrolase [Sphingomonas psychrotolerans]|uniref:Alpha/beta hydrolase n=1 Tax=Sphingomonas psychrotolerans TaxID=1327635 RepID=A0ABU3N419_9SPHN|nr:alpha/beta hydrolase [Sphingomonas psychrotolerans]MDT8759283.1 alpha/beta hydrolase [Sphingomonas psychrotolerans]